MSDENKWHIAIVREVDGLEVEMGFDTPFELKRLLKTMSDHIGDDIPEKISGDDIPEKISIEAIGGTR